MEAPTNLVEFITAEVARQGSTENVQIIVEKNISKVIEDAVKNAMQSWGSVGKQIEAAVAKSLELPSPLDVPAYGTMVLAVLRQRMDEVLAPIVNERLADEMADILKIGAREMKLSQIVKAVKDSQDASDRFQSSITLILEKYDSPSLKGYLRIYIDPEDGVDKRRCAVQLDVTAGGKISSLSVDQKDASKTIVMGALYGWERMLFALYATGGKLIVDGGSAYDFDTSFGDY